jgi:uncharacterized delta-60 repeat protein
MNMKIEKSVFPIFLLLLLVSIPFLTCQICQNQAYKTQNDSDLAKYILISGMHDLDTSSVWTDAKGVAVDGSGNIYITGYKGSSEMAFEDVFLAKFSSAGDLEWNETWGGSYKDVGSGIAVDGSGNIYITGTTESYDPGVGQAFLARYNSSGDQKWISYWGGSKVDSGNGVAVDGSGNIYITGTTYSYGAGMDDAFLARYNSSGALKWDETWGGSEEDEGNGVAVDGSGNIYITGTTYSYDLGGGQAFLARYNSSGVLEWNETWGEWYNDYGNGVAMDGSDIIYITGTTENYGAVYEDVFLARYNSSGALEWSETWGGDNHDYGYDVALDGSGNIYITGTTGTTYSYGLGGAFLAKYDGSGKLLWSIPPLPAADSINLLPFLFTGEESQLIDGYCIIPLVGAISITITIIVQKTRKRKT